jgi:hypothetical protein
VFLEGKPTPTVSPGTLWSIDHAGFAQKLVGVALATYTSTCTGMPTLLKPQASSGSESSHGTVVLQFFPQT